MRRIALSVALLLLFCISASASEAEKLLALMRSFANNPAGNFSITLPASIGEIEMAYRQSEKNPFLYIELDELTVEIDERKKGQPRFIDRGVVRIAFRVQLDGTLIGMEEVKPRRKTIKLTTAARERATRILEDLIEDMAALVKQKQRERA